MCVRVCVRVPGGTDCREQSRSNKQSKGFCAMIGTADIIDL